MMQERQIQLESWIKCLKNANMLYKQAENKYRTQRLKEELTYDGIITRGNSEKAKNQLQLAISHMNWAQDGLNEFMDQRPSF